MEDKILLVIPFYNCEKQICRVLEKIDAETLSYLGEIILINNCSLDNGEEVAYQYCVKNPQLPIKILRNNTNYGLGGSHKVGFQYAIENGFDYVIVLHGDDQGNIGDFKSMIKEKKYVGYDIVLGTRFMKKSVLEGYSVIRIWGNKIFNLIFSMILRAPIHDLGSGLNMYSVQLLRGQYYTLFRDDLYFEVDMIMAAQYYKHKVLEIPISWGELDQVSNNKLIKCAISLFYMLREWIKSPKKYLKMDHRKMAIDRYAYQIVYSNEERQRM